MFHVKSRPGVRGNDVYPGVIGLGFQLGQLLEQDGARLGHRLGTGRPGLMADYNWDGNGIGGGDGCNRGGRRQRRTGGRRV